MITEARGWFVKLEDEGIAIYRPLIFWDARSEAVVGWMVDTSGPRRCPDSVFFAGYVYRTDPGLKEWQRDRDGSSPTQNLWTRGLFELESQHQRSVGTDLQRNTEKNRRDEKMVFEVGMKVKSPSGWQGVITSIANGVAQFEDEIHGGYCSVTVSHLTLVEPKVDYQSLYEETKKALEVLREEYDQLRIDHWAVTPTPPPGYEIVGKLYGYGQRVEPDWQWYSTGNPPQGWSEHGPPSHEWLSGFWHGGGIMARPIPTPVAPLESKQEVFEGTVTHTSRTAAYVKLDGSAKNLQIDQRVQVVKAPSNKSEATQ